MHLVGVLHNVVQLLGRPLLVQFGAFPGERVPGGAPLLPLLEVLLFGYDALEHGFGGQVADVTVTPVADRADAVVVGAVENAP